MQFSKTGLKYKSEFNFTNLKIINYLRKILHGKKFYDLCFEMYTKTTYGVINFRLQGEQIKNEEKNLIASNKRSNFVKMAIT